jgi:heptosyltransferase I
MQSTPLSSLCIVRLSALGDVSHVLPLVDAIHTQVPHCDVHWLVGKSEARLLENVRNLTLHRYDKKSRWRGFLQLRADLQPWQFSASLHMQLALRANILGLAVRADRRIGFDWARSKELHSLLINERIVAAPLMRQHVVDAFMQFLPTIGLAIPTQLHWPLPITDEARVFAQEKIPGPDPYLVISPCSSHPLRNWSAQRYAKVADFAQSKLRLRVVLVGGCGPVEIAMRDAIIASADYKMIDLVGQDTLQQLLAILQNAAVVLSPDSGPAHLASALGTPVVGLYAATDPQRSGPYRFRHLCTDHFELAATQFLHREPSQLPWGSKIEKPGVMDLISVDEVCELLRCATHTQRNSTYREDNIR